jgi:hypothetical protein
MTLSRYYLLWSYRFDIFLIVFLSFIVVALGTGMTLSNRNHAILTSIEGAKDFQVFRMNAQKLELALTHAYTKDQPTKPEEFLNSIKNLHFDTSVTPITLTPPRGMLSPHFESVDPDIDKEIKAELDKVLSEYLSEEQFWARDWDSIIFLSKSPSWVVWTLLVTIGLSAIMSYFLFNVFYFRGREIVSRHPHFGIMFAEVLILSLSPYVICLAIDTSYVDRARLLANEIQNSEFQPLFRPSLYSRSQTTTIPDLPSAGRSVFDTAVDGSDDEPHVLDKSYRSPGAILVFTLSALVTTGLWLARRVSLQVFLFSLLLGTIFTGRLVFAGSSWKFMSGQYVTILPGEIYLAFQDSEALLTALVPFVGAFLLGAFVRSIPYRAMFVTIGYTGIVVLSATLLAFLVAVRHTDKMMSVAAAFLLISASIVAIHCVAEILMYRFLYEPEP